MLNPTIKNKNKIKKQEEHYSTKQATTKKIDASAK